jgi:co-chaperonin GroES (HSP10)
MNQIKPLHRNILARLRPVEEVTEGGIFVPQGAIITGRNEPAYVTVLAVGPKVETVKEGWNLALRPGAYNLLDEKEGLCCFIEDFDRIIIGQV